MDVDMRQNRNGSTWVDDLAETGDGLFQFIAVYEKFHDVSFQWVNVDSGG